MADFTIKSHDQLPSIQATLSTPREVDGVTVAVLVDLTNTSGVDFIMRLESGGTVKVNAAAVVVDAVGGVVRYDWAAADTATPGLYQAEWQVTWGDGKQQTFPTLTYHTVSILADLDGA